MQGAKMPKITKIDAWDGKDGELPEEEDIDLSDVDLDDLKDELWRERESCFLLTTTNSLWFPSFLPGDVLYNIKRHGMWINITHFSSFAIPLFP